MREVQWGSTEDWGPFEVFDELQKTPFCPWKRKQGHVAEFEDGGLLGFAAFKDLQVSLEEGAEEEVPLNIQDLWVVPKRVTHDTNIGDVYGVGLERTRIVTMRIWTSQVKLPLAPLLTFITHQPSPLPPLTVPRSWCSRMMWMRQCCRQWRGAGCMSGPMLSSRSFAGSIV